jgi:hypothetical protein
VLDDLLTLREQARTRQHKGFPDDHAKKDANQPRPIIHLGMMGDGTEEQNLGERGDPAQRIKEDEVEAAFNQPAPKKKP